MEVNSALKVLKIHSVAPSTLSPIFYHFNAHFLDAFIGFGSVQVSLPFSCLFFCWLEVEARWDLLVTVGNGLSMV